MGDEIKYSSRSDSKRKFDDDGGAISPSTAAPASGRRPTGFSAPIVAHPGSVGLASSNSVPPSPDGIELAKQRAQEIAARIFSDAEAKRPRVDNGGSTEESGNRGFVPGLQHGVNAPSNSYGFPASSKRIDIPNGRVGVIIGKSGETIKYLQVQSGARIQVTRDMDSDPSGQTRPVELLGTPEQISKAEQLINEVLSEADAGGSSIISARKFTSVSTGSDHFSMKVPNNKVGLIIGKGGETIKNMQATSGARIQVIPLHLPPGDTSLERTVHIDGTPEQIELAKQLINDVTSENRGRNTQTGGYRPPRAPSSWVPSGAPPMQQPAYGYMPPGAYSGPPPQYNTSQSPYGGYPPQVSSGWDQSQQSNAQQTTQGTGYDYGQQQQPTGVSSASTDGTSYYNQMPQAYAAQGQYGGEAAYSHAAAGYQQGYGMPGGYPQSAYPQQGYGLASTQEGSAVTYGGQASAQASLPPGQSSSAQQGYSAQQSSAAAQPGYGAPTASQPGYGNQQSAQAEYPSQTGYVQPSQAQKPPPSQSGYVQPAQGYGQVYAPPPPAAQSGYAQDPQLLAAGYGSSVAQAGYAQPQSYVGAQQSQATGYVQQQQQPYGDAYSGGGYAQPSYTADGNHVSHDAPPAAPSATGGAAKASAQS